MTCAACALSITDTLSKLEGVSDILMIQGWFSGPELITVTIMSTIWFYHKGQ
jgi:copper chaperone CopZ